MSFESVTIRRASEEDLGEILELLTITNLPHDGVVEYLSEFQVAREGNGRLIGCLGLEKHNQTGLLRSVAIAPDLQRSGLGSRLTSALLEQAAKEGIKEMVLLTTTARDFFSKRFGFKEADRADYDDRLSQSPEWRLPRCSSAVFMRLDLNKSI
jgi:amino-acid N-acetyltransferase